MVQEHGQAEQANVSLCPNLDCADLRGRQLAQGIEICPHLRAIVHHGSERAKYEEFQAMAAQNNVVYLLHSEI